MSAAFRSTSPDEAVPEAAGELIPATTTQTKRLALLRGPDRWWKNPHVRAYSYPGRIDVSRLEQALRLVARRHSGLRIHFHPDDPIDSARCLPADEATFPFREMTAGSDPAAADAEAHAWLAQQFSPYERPLYRALVLHRPETDMFGLSIEQSILDHAGALALYEDITRVYDGLADRSASAFDELVSDATRFARDERAWFAGEDAAKTLAWWDEYNEGLGAYPGLDLPAQGTVDTWAPIINHDLRLSAADTIQLKQHAQRQRLTPTMLASAATAVTLRAHGHSGDVRFLFATSRRVLPGTEKAIGYFSNRMMLRIPVTPQDTVSSLAPRGAGRRPGRGRAQPVQPRRVCPDPVSGRLRPGTDLLRVSQHRRVRPAAAAGRAAARTGIRTHAQPGLPPARSGPGAPAVRRRPSGRQRESARRVCTRANSSKRSPRTSPQGQCVGATPG